MLLIFPQMAAGQKHENVFEAGLARAQMLELLALPGYRVQKSGNGEVRLADTQADGRILAANRLYAGPRRSIRSDGAPSAMIWP